MTSPLPLSEPKPLPCPFCGSPAGEIVHHFHPMIERDGTITEARSVQCSQMYKACLGNGPIEDSEAKAIAAWNRRASLSPTAEGPIQERTPDVPKNCAMHDGNWSSECADCEKVRKFFVKRTGSWTVGDKTRANLPLATDAELHALRVCVGWAATGSDNPSYEEVELARLALLRMSGLRGAASPTPTTSVPGDTDGWLVASDPHGTAEEVFGSGEPLRLTQEPNECYATCIAAITHIPVEELPRCPENADDDGVRMEYYSRLNAALLERGWTMTRHWGKGFPLGYAIGSGESPRGISHAVIVKDGQLWHDPHPSRAGVVGPFTRYEILYRAAMSAPRDQKGEGNG